MDRMKNDIVMSCASISKTKWDKIIQENIIPLDLVADVAFEEEPSNWNFEAPKDYPNIGVLRVKNVVPVNDLTTIVRVFS